MILYPSLLKHFYLHKEQSYMNTCKPHGFCHCICLFVSIIYDCTHFYRLYMAEMYYNKAYTTPDNQSIDQKYLYSSECPDGYFGNNCSSECRPPTYGTLCQKSCDCLNSACHFIHGCTVELQFN